MAATRPHRDDQCLERGPALSHITDNDETCVYCGLEVSLADPKKGYRPVTFTERELGKVRLLRWMREHGRI